MTSLTTNHVLVSYGFLFILFLRIVLVLTQHNHQVNLRKLKSDEIAIIQYDSRKLRDYWLVSASWNKRYCDRHGHLFIYYTSDSGCYYHNDFIEREKLATPWCKVKAMLAANQEYPSVKLFIYMDSDAVIDRTFESIPVQSMLGIMQDKLLWDPLTKPMVFNQDGPCWWCNLIEEVGYNMCLNAGTVVWYRHEKSEYILQSWWDASMDSYDTNPIKRKFRLKWPWEQDRQMAVYNRSSELIQIASQPKRSKMQTRVGLLTQGTDTGWCLSHLPGWGCFISHYCSSSHAKEVMESLYGTNAIAPDVYQALKAKKKKKMKQQGKHQNEATTSNFTISYLQLS